MTKDEALKQALEYLRDNQHYIADNERHVYVMEYNAFVERLEALAEQPAPPPECKTDAEKTAFAFGWWKALEENRKQPIKPWVGLTDEERDEIYNTHEPYADLKAVEAKLREKNA